MTETIDQANRNRFVSELDKNFSVVAAAGSLRASAATRIFLLSILGSRAMAQLLRFPAARLASWF